MVHEWDRLFLEVNHIEIVDSPLFGSKREMTYLTCNRRHSGSGFQFPFVYEFDATVVHLISFEVTQTYKMHKRTATQLSDELAVVGGLTEFVYIGFWGSYFIFGQPFRDLSLGLSYSKLIDSINNDTAH